MAMQVRPNPPSEDSLLSLEPTLSAEPVSFVLSSEPVSSVEPTLSLEPATPSRKQRRRAILYFLLDLAIVAAIAAVSIWAALSFGRLNDSSFLYFDEKVYDLLARNLWQKGFFGYAPGRWTSARPPAYPAFLALIFSYFGHSLSAVRIAQAMLAAGSVIFAYLTGKLLFNRKAGFLGAVFMILAGSTFYYAHYLLSETFATFTTAGGLYFLLRGWQKGSKASMTVGGIFVALVILSRGVALFLPLLVLVIAALHPRLDAGRVKAIVFFCLAILLVITPWTIRNVLEHRQLTWVSTNGGVNLWLANNPHSTGDYFPPYSVMTKKQIQEIKQADGEVNEDRVWYTWALNYMIKHPQKTLESAFKNMKSFLWEKVGPVTEYKVDRSTSVPVLPFRILAVISLSGFVLSLRRRDKGLVLLAGSVLYYIAFHSFFLPLPRYRELILPALAVYAGYTPAFILSGLIAFERLVFKQAKVWVGIRPGRHRISPSGRSLKPSPTAPACVEIPADLA